MSSNEDFDIDKVTIRLSKLMSERGLCSRREADTFIERGWVYVDGVQVSTLGTKVDPDAKVTLDERAKKTQARLVTILMNKPVGYVSGQPEQGYKTAMSLIGRDTHYEKDRTRITFSPAHMKGLAPAGRLDIDSTGLIVFTQDGRVAKSLIGESSGIEKEYLVRVEGELSDEGFDLLQHGLSLDGRPLKPAVVWWQNEDQLRFVLKEGRKRQIRRMCEKVGLRVTGLKRVRIGNVMLGNMPQGQWRYMAEDEEF
ncbi:MAG: rRNA pseudouridine synthase [Nitrospirae bacterium]|nr:rRNA pseudouridine synthase [Nitrospirota bacterium]